MIHRLLIANRGEIACRIIKTAQRRGIETLAVYSDADQGSLHTEMADQAFRLPGELPVDTYLNINLIIELAIKNQADAIHPGYGFLSENPEFCQACEKHNLIFVGPSSEIIRQMGDKAAAKTLIQSIDVPTLTSFQETNSQDTGSQEIKRFQQAAKKIGFPVLIKAVAGGGGKGMRIVEQENLFASAYQSAQSEALASFGNGSVLIEKYLPAPRHVEVQVFADNQGTCLTLSTRDCSIQRRYQKIIEEAPAPNLSTELRNKLAESAAKIVSTLHYQGAGTIEFLVDGEDYYFMEMNTRLQVEHPTTEQVMGHDLVDWQISVAEGKPLPVTQQQLAAQGHSIEARIYAEDPYQQFLPIAGKLHQVEFPEPTPSTRIDSGIRSGDTLSPYYDPMVAKVICHGASRTEAIALLTRALDQVHLAGIRTNLDFLKSVLSSESFGAATLNTAFINEHSQSLFNIEQQEIQHHLIASALFFVAQQSQHYRNTPRCSPWDNHNTWRLNQTSRQTLSIKLAAPSSIEKTYSVEISRPQSKNNSAELNLEISFEGQTHSISGSVDQKCIRYGNDQQQFAIPHYYHSPALTLFGKSYTTQWLVHSELNHDYGSSSKQGNGNTAPMSGRIVQLLAEPGETLQAGAPVLTMEAMKMEHTLKMANAGELTQFCCQPNDIVKEDDVLYLFTSHTEPLEKELN